MVNVNLKLRVALGALMALYPAFAAAEQFDQSQGPAEVAPSTEPGLGRVPLRSGQGSFGFKTETRVKPEQGTVIPSLQANESRIRPFMGLSLSVPTSDK